MKLNFELARTEGLLVKLVDQELDSNNVCFRLHNAAFP